MDNSSARLIPYRNRPPELIQQQINLAKNLKLYLISESGPTSFTFRDTEQNKFKVSIGQQVSCSCQPQRKDHCCHTLYTLLRKFRIVETNPILWQGSYLDSELTDLISGKFDFQKIDQRKLYKRVALPKQSNNSTVLQERNVHYQRYNMEETKQNEVCNTIRQQLENQAICPICQEEPLTFCKKKCGNNFHLECLKIWIEHKTQTNEVISCPMCRVNMGENLIIEIEYEMSEFNNQFVTHEGTICEFCKVTPIVGNIYHCLYCENVNLCIRCFENDRHQQHDKFLVKQRNDGAWVIPPDRNPNRFSVTRISNGLTETLESQDRKMNDERNILIDERMKMKPRRVYANTKEYFLSCFPQSNKEDNNYKSNQKENYVPQFCVCCAQKNQNMKKLFCGHLVDIGILQILKKFSDCLSIMFEHQSFKCPIDNQIILKGYNSLLPKQQQTIQQNQIEEEKQEIDNEQKNFVEELLKNDFGIDLGKIREENMEISRLIKKQTQEEIKNDPCLNDQFNFQNNPQQEYQGQQYYNFPDENRLFQPNFTRKTPANHSKRKATSMHSKNITNQSDMTENTKLQYENWKKQTLGSEIKPYHHQNQSLNTQLDRRMNSRQGLSSEVQQEQSPEQMDEFFNQMKSEQQNNQRQLHLNQGCLRQFAQLPQNSNLSISQNLNSTINKNIANNINLQQQTQLTVNTKGNSNNQHNLNSNTNQPSVNSMNTSNIVYPNINNLNSQSNSSTIPQIHSNTNNQVYQQNISQNNGHYINKEQSVSVYPIINQSQIQNQIPMINQTNSQYPITQPNAQPNSHQNSQIINSINCPVISQPHNSQPQVQYNQISSNLNCPQISNNIAHNNNLSNQQQNNVNYPNMQIFYKIQDQNIILQIFYNRDSHISNTNALGQLNSNNLSALNGNSNQAQNINNDITSIQAQGQIKNCIQKPAFNSSTGNWKKNPLANSKCLDNLNPRKGNFVNGQRKKLQKNSNNNDSNIFQLPQINMNQITQRFNRNR